MNQLLVLVFSVGVSLFAHESFAQKQSPAATPPSLLIITNVNVVDVVAGEVLANRMVVVRDGCIESIDTRAPAGRAVQRLDGRGKYLVPGLWDTHVQAPVGETNERRLLAKLVASGITSIRYFAAPANRATVLATIRAVEASEQMGPRMMLASAGAAHQVRNGGLMDELSRLVTSGQSTLQALQAATVVPAIAAGYRYTLGQVAPDFRADLVLLDANPLNDIRHLLQVRAVVLRGRVFERAALDALKTDVQTPALPNSLEVKLRAVGH
jgi:imidazolonepropionase-like amidohydrolase